MFRFSVAHYNNFAKHGNDYKNDKEFVVMASSSSLRPRNDNSNMDIAEHVMASSSSLQRTSSSGKMLKTMFMSIFV